MVKKNHIGPIYKDLIIPAYDALKEIGGSGKNEEITEKIIENLHLSDAVVDEPHIMKNGRENGSELNYQLAWARSYLKWYGAITNSKRGVWAINNDFSKEITVEGILTFIREQSANTKSKEKNVILTEGDFPDETQLWRQKLSEILQNMDPYAFERLAQRVLRECGFTNVEVTKKSGDGGIDGNGKLRINGIFSFNVAFQCKRYKDLVGAPAIRDFRGSLTTDIEKWVFITTGTFSKAAREEASNPGKQQIDLIDGDDFMDKLAEYGIGVQEVKTYEIDSEFFDKI